MVAVSSSTVARGGMGVWAWALWALVLVQSLAHANSRPNEKFGDVSGEEVVIDQLEDFLRSHGRQVPQPNPHLSDPRLSDNSFPHPISNLNEKIKFGVGPRDPRFFLPPNRPANPPEVRDYQHHFPEDLALLASRLPQHQRPSFGEEVLQYRDEDAEDQFRPQYPVEDGYGPQYEAQYPDYSNLNIPVDAETLVHRLQQMQELRGGPRMKGVAEEVEQEEEEGGREEDKRMLDAAKLEDDKEETKEEKKKASAKAATSQPEEVHYLNRSPSHAQQGDPTYQHHKASRQESLDGVYFVAIVAGCTAVAVFGVISAGICWYRLNKNHRAAQVADYPAYGVTGPNKDLSPSSGDRKLAQSAHMYHYQHQKQQMIALEKSSGGERHGSTSDVDSEEEGEENEYTVYECPGLAPTGEMEVKNPLFHDDPTPATPSMRKEADDEEEEEEEPKAK